MSPPGRDQVADAKYEQIASDLLEQITRGSLRPSTLPQQMLAPERIAGSG